MNDQTACVIHPTVSLEGYESLGVATYRASTIRFSDSHAYATRLERGDDGYSYGLYGTPTGRTLEKQIAHLEQAVRTFLVPSGQGAVALAMLALLKMGDAVLIPDSVYPPVRDFADTDLARYGIRAIYYDPSQPLPAIDDAVRLIWVESPGSTTMEIQDLPAIAKQAQARGILVGCDNTWATPLLFKPLGFGADISVQAVTKYISGHSDVLMGSISVRDRGLATQIKKFLGRLGIGTSADDCSLALRGLETLPVRLAHQGQAALRIAQWIAEQPLVDRVLHPALEDCPGHSLWRRDFAGASGVFSVLLKPRAVAHVHAALDTMKTFAIGASWGGTRSLIVPMSVKAFRTARPWSDPDLVLRLSIGLEAESDLMSDLTRFFDHLARHSANGEDSVSAPV
jgi:cystathionine beta-lyase